MTTDILIFEADKNHFIEAINELASDGVEITDLHAQNDWLCITIKYSKPNHLYYVGLKFGRIITSSQYKPFDI